LGFFTISETESDSSNPKGLMAYAIVSTYMAIGALSSFIIFKSNNKYKYSFLVISIFCLIALFINNSRTSQISFLLSIITLSLFYYRSHIFKPKILISIVSIFLILLSFFYFVLSQNGKLQRYKIAVNETIEVLSENKYSGSFGARLYFNVAGFEILSENLFFGMGPEDNINKLKELIIRDQHDKINFETVYASFHSQHMDILTRYGLFGYLLLFISVITLIFSLRKLKTIYWVGMSFFITTFYASLANVMLIKKPFNYIFISVFVLLSVAAYLKQKETYDNTN